MTGRRSATCRVPTVAAGVAAGETAASAARASAACTGQRVVPGLGGVLWPATFVVIQVVTNVYYHRAGLYRILGARWLART